MGQHNEWCGDPCEHDTWDAFDVEDAVESFYAQGQGYGFLVFELDFGFFMVPVNEDGTQVESGRWALSIRAAKEAGVDFLYDALDEDYSDQVMG